MYVYLCVFVVFMYRCVRVYAEKQVGESMYVYLCVCVCVCARAMLLRRYIYECIYVCTSVCTYHQSLKDSCGFHHMCMYVRMRVYMYRCIDVFMHECMHAFMYVK
jgi:hypothetical protein